MHFTYNENPDMDSLCQGDILVISDEIKSVLKICHPYFLKADYKFFIVLTQSCDLVRRNGKDCKSPYITLAAVRSLDDFINRRASSKAKEINGIKLLEESDFSRFKQLLERVFNNNESEHFFLAKDPDLNFNEPMVAYLKVSFALKSGLHYDKCINAKILELSDEFKAKLGWLVGQMYSRVGTKDWECSLTRKEFMTMIEKEIKSRFIVSGKKKLALLKKDIENNGIIFKDSSSLRDHMNSISVKSNYDEIMEIIQDTVEKQKNLGTEVDRQTLIRKIRSLRKIQSIVK